MKSEKLALINHLVSVSKGEKNHLKYMMNHAYTLTDMIQDSFDEENFCKKYIENYSKTILFKDAYNSYIQRLEKFRR